MSVSAGEIERAESRAKAKAPRQCAEEYRLEAVEYYRRAREADPKKSIRECAAELGINDKTLNDWVIKFGRTGKVTQARTDEQKEPDEARRRIRELESENESLKKSSSLLRQEPLTEDRFRLMLEEKADYSVSMMARVLGVSRSGFYRWPKAGGSGEDPGGPLKEAIIETWDASGRRFGLRKAWSKLTGDPKYGRFAGTTPYRVRKCMSELGIRGICPNASRRTTVPDRDAPARPDLMGSDFPGPVPTTKLVGDITYLRTTGGFICLAVVIDLCARMVVGWSMRDNMRAGLVVAALEMARSRGHVAGGAMFHSDRGSQHASAELAAWAAAHDVRLSVGRTGSRHDNAVAESFFGTLKSEWYHHERPSDASTTKHGAIEFIESYYNRFRPHESIGDRVPAEAMQEFFDRFESALQADPEAMLAA